MNRLRLLLESFTFKFKYLSDQKNRSKETWNTLVFSLCHYTQFFVNWYVPVVVACCMLACCFIDCASCFVCSMCFNYACCPTDAATDCDLFDFDTLPSGSVNAACFDRPLSPHPLVSELSLLRDTKCCCFPSPESVRLAFLYVFFTMSHFYILCF